MGIAGTEITTLGDNDLTKLRREHIGFVFQFFNLLPMLDARENILLPLTIAGEKPDDGWFDQIVKDVGLQDRLSHRPAELSGGQQQRVAIARALISRPTVLFADEPTGNLDSATSGEILELLRRSVDEYGQTIVMVTHELARRRRRASRALPRRRPDRARARRVRSARRSTRSWKKSPRRERTEMTVRLRGLSSRKLRTALTAIAIVLGVAMISGTYVLTDSIDQAFDRIFTDIRQGSNAVITGKSAFDLSDRSGVTAPTLDESLLPQVRELPDVAEAEGSVDSDATQLIGDDGKAVVFGGAPNLGFSIANGDSVFNPLTLVDGTWPGPTRSSIDKETAAKEDFEVGETIGVQAEGPVERLRVSGIVQFSSGLTIGGATLAGFDLPTAQRLFKKVGPARRDRRRREAGRAPTRELVARDPADPAARRAQVQDGQRAGGDGRRGHERVHLVPPDVPARVRRDRALRRLLRHRELALDHDRAADARVRHAADDRRDEPPDPRFGDRRGARRRRRRVGRRPLPRAPAREGPLRAVRRRRLHAPEHGPRLRAADDRRRARRRDPRHASRERLSGLPRDDRSPDRGGSRRRRRFRASRSIACADAPGRRRDRASASSSASSAITTTPGNTLVSILLAVLGLILTLFGCALFPSRTLGALVSWRSASPRSSTGSSCPGLGTTSVLLWMGLGVLLVFFGVARVTTRLIPRLSVLMSPIARWSVFLLAVLFWPFFTLPYWLLRYGAWGPGGVGQRVLAFLGGALLNPLILLIVLVMWLRKARDAAGSRSGRRSSRASSRTARRRASAPRTRVATRSAPPRRRRR